MGHQESTSASGVATGHETEMARGQYCLLPDPPPEAAARVEQPTMGAPRLCLTADEPRPEAPRASAWEVTDLDDADLGARGPASAGSVAVGHEVECARGALCLFPMPPVEAKIDGGDPKMGVGRACLLPEDVGSPEMVFGRLCLLPEETPEGRLHIQEPMMVKGSYCLLPQPPVSASAVGYEIKLARGVFCLLPTPSTEGIESIDAPTMVNGRLCLVGDEPAPEAPSSRARWGVTALDDEELAGESTSIAVGYEVEFGRGFMCLLPEPELV